MKGKFIFFLVLLILIGGTVFYFGWIQFRVEENTYGVIFTKTGGYDEKVVTPGVFIWRWEALIPTNFTLHKFEIKPRTSLVSRSGTLPSGDIYSGVLDNKTDFSYTLKVRIDYSLKPEKLTELVQDDGLTPENLEDWFNRTEQELTNLVSDSIQSRIADFDSSSEQFFLTPFREDMLASISSGNDYIQVSEISVAELELPDIQLYRASRDYYLALLNTRLSAEKEMLEKERSWTVSEESKLAVLREYGELFTEYPGLIQFLSLSNKSDLQDLLPDIDILHAGQAVETDLDE